jgi:hypothetical protein
MRHKLLITTKLFNMLASEREPETLLKKSTRRHSLGAFRIAYPCSFHLQFFILGANDDDAAAAAVAAEIVLVKFIYVK